MDKISGTLVETFDVAALLLGQEKSNPYLQPGDIVDVPEAGVAYLIGGVVRPQAIILRGPTTIRQAIALAGGLRPGTNADKIYIHRQSPENSTLINIRVDLKAIMKGHAKEFLLQPYDIVEVRGRGPGIMPPPISPVKPEVIQQGTRVIY